MHSACRCTAAAAAAPVLTLAVCVLLLLLLLLLLTMIVAAPLMQEYMDNLIVETFDFNEEETRAAELQMPAAADVQLPHEVVRSKVSTRGTRTVAGMMGSSSTGSSSTGSSSNQPEQQPLVGQQSFF